MRKKKRDFLSEKRESGMTLKKREFTPESGSVDTYAKCIKDKANCIVHAYSTYQKKKVQGGSLIWAFFSPKIT